MPPKKNDRLDKIEATVHMLMEVMNQRAIVRKDCEVQTVPFKQKTMVDRMAQTQPVRRNITERGNQICIKPTVTSIGTSMEQKTQNDADTQTEKTIAVSEIFMKKINQRVLGHLAAIDAHGVDDPAAAQSLRSIQNRKFNSEDVVVALKCACQMALMYASLESADEYESYDEAAQEDGQRGTQGAQGGTQGTQGGALYFKVRHAGS